MPDGSRVSHTRSSERTLCGRYRFKLETAVLLAVTAAAPLVAEPPSDPDAKAASTLAQMTQEEKLSVLQGFVIQTWPKRFPTNVVKGAGYVPGVPRLGIPALTESD